MFSKYFYIAKGGEVKVKDTVDLNPAQQMVAQKLLDNINQGVQIMDDLDKIPPEVLKAMTAAAAMGMVLGKLSEAAKC